MMSFQPAAVLLHTISAAIMGYGYELNQGSHGEVTEAWIQSQKGGHFQFLTIQGLAVAWITMVCSLALDLFPSFTNLRKTKRALFMVAMPVAVVVASIYWPLLLFHPELILIMDPYSPPTAPALLYVSPSIDVALHAIPSITLLLDFMFFEKKYQRKEALYGAPVVTSLATVGYGCWVEYCASYNGRFPYPFLTENPLEIRIAIYTGAATLALVSFWMINSIHS